jgi:lysine 2,3-aminomutase
MQIISDSFVKEFNRQADEKGLLRIKVPPYYKKLITEEFKAVGSSGGPLYKIVYPCDDYTEIGIGHEVPDFVEDRTNMPLGVENILIHKYKNRALFLVTDKCAGHCMYCFRKDVLTGLQGRNTPNREEKLNLLINYLKQNPNVNEIILSGGDPLSVPFNYLRTILERLKAEAKIRDLRLHTRNIVFAPKIISGQLCELLDRYKVRIYLHIVHPYELTEEVIKAIVMLRDHKIRTYAQLPVLRGINDHVTVLEKLIYVLDSLGVNVVSLFIPDPVRYSAPFRIPMKRLFSLMDNLYWSGGSWLNGVRIVLDTPIGKVRREDIVSWDEKKNIIVFQREGKKIIYDDFPAESDNPGDIKTLLWKDGIRLDQRRGTA